jgi:fatty-acyl-CoA synthase
MHAYGLTETAPLISVCESRPEDEELAPHERATLKARQGVELMTSGELCVVGPDGSDVPCDGQTLGEVVARGNVVMEGYYNDPAATAKAMEGGWFHTGDAAVVHPDGYMEIRDRFKDVIISGGENISSVEVEGVLLQHAAVVEAGVVGVPDAKWGERVEAAIQLKPGARFDEGGIVAFLKERVGSVKTPKKIHVAESLPRSAVGKVLRREARRLFAGGA